MSNARAGAPGYATMVRNGECFPRIEGGMKRGIQGAADDSVAQKEPLRYQPLVQKLRIALLYVVMEITLSWERQD